MKLTKKATKSLTQDITSLLVYHSMVKDYNLENRSEDAFRAMAWYNEAADSLAKMGIVVTKYETA